MASNSTTITLVDQGAVRNFVRGDRFVFFGNRWHRARWYHGLWKRLTWWRQPRHIVTAIDVARGMVTVTPMRWSWRRWRWEIA